MATLDEKARKFLEEPFVGEVTTLRPDGSPHTTVVWVDVDTDEVIFNTAAGLPRVEAVSFVRDDLVPQMARAEEVVGGIERRDGTEYSGLVLNEQGYERFAAAGLDRVNVTLGATESFNQRNGNASLDEAVARVERILAEASVPATVTISVAFGCPFEGRVDPGRV